MAEAAPAHVRSEGTLNPALRIFKVPPTDSSINAYRMVTIQPTTTSINPMEFIIPGLDNFVDLGRSYFTMELSLKKSNNRNLVANEKLWPVNNLTHSIIKQIDLLLNGTLISPQSDTYHYKAYLETLLNYDREDGQTVLGPQGWFNQVDFPPQWTANNTNSAGPHVDYRNLSANHKGALAASVAEVTKYAGGVTHSLVFTPHLEVFHTGKLLVPGIEIKMKFHFKGPNLFLNGVGLAGRLMEGDVKLRLNETVYKNLSSQRHNEGQIATYPTVRSGIRTFSMQGNLVRFDIPNLFQNRVPDRLIVGLVDSRAVFEPAQLPQETICPSVAFAKGQIGNSRGQSIIYYSINTVFVLSNKLSFCCPRKNKTLLKQCCGCGKCKFSFIFTVCKFTLINQTKTCCVIVQLNIHLSAL